MGSVVAILTIVVMFTTATISATVSMGWVAVAVAAVVALAAALTSATGRTSSLSSSTPCPDTITKFNPSPHGVFAHPYHAHRHRARYVPASRAPPLWATPSAASVDTSFTAAAAATSHANTAAAASANAAATTKPQATPVAPLSPPVLAEDMDVRDADPELHRLMVDEFDRQTTGLELIASENFTSTAVMQCLGSCMTNKYSEGYPGARFYGGNQIIDQVETLCQQRALEAYRLDPTEWAVNVQPYSGSPANFATYTALLSPGDTILGLDLPSGGHLTHGHHHVNSATQERTPVSATSIYFNTQSYGVDSQTSCIDYRMLQEQALRHKPNLIICGASAYPRDWDYAQFRQVANEVGALLMMDMAHISGLVAAGEQANPFDFCDVVTTTTHKSLRGPRAGMVFSRRDQRDLPSRIDRAVFPSLQGGPHQNQIAALATQLLQVRQPAFKQYSRQVRANARALAAGLAERGHTLSTGGTDNHLILWDLRPHGITGSKMQVLCDEANITLNKNSVHGDISAVIPGGVRVGSPALTTRGFREEEFLKVAELLDRALRLCVDIQDKSGSKKLDAFKLAAMDDARVAQLRSEVEALASVFPMPGLRP